MNETLIIVLHDTKDYVSQVLPANTPFATPQKRESFRKQRTDSDNESYEEVKRRLGEAEAKLEVKESEIKDLEVKLFEKSVVRVIGCTARNLLCMQVSN